MIPITPTTQLFQSQPNRVVAPAGVGHGEQFGMLGANVVQRILQPIAENYLAGFMAQDVFSLWAPRIVGSLQRGSIGYDVQNDPMATQRTPREQWWHALKQNVKGLNYWNAWEETAREIQSGPGFMLWGIAIFGVGMATMVGKRSLLMSYKEVKTYWQMLKKAITPAVAEQLPRLNQQQQHNVLMTSHLKNALGHFFDAQALNKIVEIKPHTQAMSGESEKQFWSWMRGLANEKNPTVGQVLDHWMTDYVKLLGQPQEHRQLAKTLPTLEQRFEELVFWVNTNLKGVTHPTGLTKLSLPNKTLPITSPEAMDLLHATEKLSSGLKDLLQRQSQHGLPKTAEAWHLKVNQFARRVIDLKLPLCLGATIMGGVNHFYVSSISQVKDRSYPANRLIPLDDSGLNNLKAKTFTSPLPNTGGQPVV